MKKILFTTILVSSVFSVAMAGSKSGSKPSVTINGFSDFQVAITEEDLLGTDKDIVFRNDNELKFTFSGKTRTGVEYGAVLDLEADVSNDTNANRTHIYIQRDTWGRLEFGSKDAVTNTMRVDAGKIARGTGGIDGDFRKYIVYSTGAGTAGLASTIIRPASPMGSYHKGDGYEESTKLNYYSPKYQGFQWGVSFTPEVNNEGQIVSGDYAENVFSVGIKYEKKFDGLNFTIGANMDRGDATSASGIEDIEAWQVGLKFETNGFEIAGSYADWGESLMLDGSGIENTYYTVGLAYSMDKFGASVTYLLSEEDGATNTEFSNISIGADYKLAKGLTPYGEISMIDDEKSDNDGTTFMTGMQVNF